MHSPFWSGPAACHPQRTLPRGSASSLPTDGRAQVFDPPSARRDRLLDGRAAGRRRSGGPCPGAVWRVPGGPGGHAVSPGRRRAPAQGAGRQAVPSPCRRKACRKPRAACAPAGFERDPEAERVERRFFAGSRDVRPGRPADPAARRRSAWPAHGSACRPAGRGSASRRGGKEPGWAHPPVAQRMGIAASPEARMVAVPGPFRQGRRCLRPAARQWNRAGMMGSRRGQGSLGRPGTDGSSIAPGRSGRREQRRRRRRWR